MGCINSGFLSETYRIFRTFFLTNGHINLDTWLGFYLCEFLNRVAGRKIATMIMEIVDICRQKEFK